MTEHVLLYVWNKRDDPDGVDKEIERLTSQVSFLSSLILDELHKYVHVVFLTIYATGLPLLLFRFFFKASQFSLQGFHGGL